jgi:5-methylcytosine-specific restriction endonuclease McrA
MSRNRKHSGCSIPNCSRKHYAKGLCDSHYGVLSAKRRIARNPLSGRHAAAKAVAKHRGKEWTLSKQLHEYLLRQPCYYCGGKLNPTGSGLDRIDNTRGYHPDNVVPCCYDCNSIKGDRLTQEETLAAVAAIKAVRASKAR